MFQIHIHSSVYFAYIRRASLNKPQKIKQDRHHHLYSRYHHIITVLSEHTLMHRTVLNFIFDLAFKMNRTVMFGFVLSWGFLLVLMTLFEFVYRPEFEKHKMWTLFGNRPRSSPSKGKWQQLMYIWPGFKNSVRNFLHSVAAMAEPNWRTPLARGMPADIPAEWYCAWIGVSRLHYCIWIGRRLAVQ